MKTKKISKQSLVIAVLSLLLVLSMGLYATGAYFTDSSKGNVGTNTLNFGTVKLNATYGNDSEHANITSYGGYIVPGDQYYFKGKVDPDNTVEMLVAIEFTYSLVINGVPYTNGTAGSAAIYHIDNLFEGATVASPETKVLDVAAASFDGASGWTPIEKSDENANYWGENKLGTGVVLFLVAAENADVNFACHAALSATCGNVVHGSAKVGDAAATNTVFVINNTGHEAVQTAETGSYVLATSIELVSTVKAAAIQSKAGGNPIDKAIAGRDLQTILNGLTF